MRITRQELLKIQDDGELESRYLCVEFSPWQYEDYDDVKVALMTTVLDAVGGQVGGDQRPTIIHDCEPHRDAGQRTASSYRAPTGLRRR
jgi:hypothetical protein